MKRENNRIKADRAKEQQFQDQLAQKITEWREYRLSHETLINELMAQINKYKGYLNYGLIQNLQGNVESDLQFITGWKNELDDPKIKAKYDKALSVAYSSQQYDDIIKFFQKFSEEMATTMKYWTSIITKLPLDCKKELRCFDEKLTHLQQRFEEFTIDLMDKAMNQVNKMAYNVHNYKRFLPYLLTETYNLLNSNFAPEINKFYYRLYVTTTKQLFAYLISKDRVEIIPKVENDDDDDEDLVIDIKGLNHDLGPMVEEYVHEHIDENDNSINWKAEAERCYQILRSLTIPTQQPAQQEQNINPQLTHSEDNAQAPQPKIEEPDEEIEEINIHQNNNNINNNENTFLEQTPDEEILLERFVVMFNQFFGTNHTNKSISQLPFVRQHFTSIQHKVNGRKLTYYRKK